MSVLRVDKRPRRTACVGAVAVCATAGVWGGGRGSLLMRGDSKDCQIAHWKFHKAECGVVEMAELRQQQQSQAEIQGAISRNELTSYNHLPCYEAIGKLRDDLNKLSANPSPNITSENARKLLFYSEQVQFQHEQLEEEIDLVVKSLYSTFETLNITLPPRNQPRYKRLTQLKSRENLQSLILRCQSEHLEEQLESIKECRKLLSGERSHKSDILTDGLPFRPKSAHSRASGDGNGPCVC